MRTSEVTKPQPPTTTPTTSVTTPTIATGTATTAAAFLAGPVLMAGYGVARLIGRAVGDYGPGVWWSVAHVLFLAGVLAFVPVFRGLRLPAGARGGSRVGVRVAAGAGLLALVTLLAFFRRGEVPARSPLLVLAGVVMVAVSLDLLAVGALCIGLALFPVRRGPRGR